MYSWPKIPATRWLCLIALIGLGWPAAAQQAIQFSKPVDKELSGKTDPVAPPSSRALSADAFNAPKNLFGDQTPSVSFDLLPGSPQASAISAASSAQWQKFLENKKNWPLMTPEEIFGIATPEKILGVKNSKDEAKLSPEERYLRRQDRLTGTATNLSRRMDVPLWREDEMRDPFHPADAVNRFSSRNNGAVSGPERNVGGVNGLFPRLNRDAPTESDAKVESAWFSPFAPPEALRKQTPEQLAGMERFRALMEPSAPERPADTAKLFGQPNIAPDPNMQSQPLFNPLGRSFTPLESGISKPVGLAPLRGITGPQKVAEKKTTTLVQAPPWLSTPSSAQDAPLPQRQF